ncbi:MAG TPA: DUF1289 domain-containing protein [Candidatus Krumholzibacteria bacterium]|nr:DUF1289 domain-containing protein [Candidatus Krumholzibacteria bacterium]
MNEPDRRNPPPSPCNLTCIVDRQHNWCIGCLRTLDEIAAWSGMTADEQWKIIDELPARRAKTGADGTGPQ